MRSALPLAGLQVALVSQQQAGAESPTEVTACESTCAGKPAGLYTIAGIANVYCSNNAALIQQCDDHIPEAAVLAPYATSVRLEAGGVTGYSSQAVLRLAAGENWQGLSWYSDKSETEPNSWCTESVCRAGRDAKGWPNMVHSCGRRDCMHWLRDYEWSSTGVKPTSCSETWLEMRQSTESCEVPPPPRIPENVGCDNTCFGKADGSHTIAGVSVFCRNGAARIQSCGEYVREVDVRALAAYSKAVRLEAGGRSGFSVEAVTRLRSGRSWRGLSWYQSVNEFQPVASWCTHSVCWSRDATGWPNMIHSCGRAECMHWLVSSQFSLTYNPEPRDANAPCTETWLEMREPTETCGAEPTCSGPEGACEQPPKPVDTCRLTCYDKADGFYEINGIKDVYCSNNAALIQMMRTEECPVGFTDDVAALTVAGYGPTTTRLGPESCGFLSQEIVQKLAAFSSSVVLRDFERGSALGNAAAVTALQRGENWHGAEVSFNVNLTRQSPIESSEPGPHGCFNVMEGCTVAAHGWPNMYHSCGTESCFHWLVSDFHSMTNVRPPVGSSTELIMKPASEIEQCKIHY